MTLSTSAHVDTFARDNLPPAELWPTLEFTTELLQYPDRLNAATEIIDIPAATWPQRPALRTPDGDEWTYGELQTHANQVAQVLAEDLGLVRGNRVLLRSPNNPRARLLIPKPLHDHILQSEAAARSETWRNKNRQRPDKSGPRAPSPREQERRQAQSAAAALANAAGTASFDDGMDAILSAYGDDPELLAVARQQFEHSWRPRGPT